jgi:uncharacterized protein (TIRG00374 family)
LLIQLAGIALSAAKWGLVLDIRGQRQPYPWLLGVYLAGQFANNFLPTGIGGDALRAVQLGRRIGSFSQASASVFLERLTGFLALSLIANLALGLSVSDGAGAALATTPELRLLAALASLSSIAAIVVCFNAPRVLRLFGPYLPGAVRRPLAQVAELLAEYMRHGRSLALILGMSLLFQSLWVVLHLVCGLALHIQAPLLLYALMAPISDIVGLAPIFVNNLGARELVFTLYLTQIGIPPATALALAFLIFSVRLVVSVLGGLVVLFGGADLRAGRGATTTT